MFTSHFIKKLRLDCHAHRTMVILKECQQCIKVLWEGGVQKVKTFQKITGFSRKTLYRWVKQLEQTKEDLK